MAKSITLDPDIYDILIQRSPDNFSNAINELLSEALQQQQVRKDIDEMAHLVGVQIDERISAKAAVEFEKVFQRVERERAERRGQSPI
ncbi:MAG: hypothetical protein ACHQ7M_04605 [Chloroflexota bacterium]